jgi:hypothetical protein
MVPDVSESHLKGGAPVYVGKRLEVGGIEGWADAHQVQTGQQRERVNLFSVAWVFYKRGLFSSHFGGGLKSQGWAVSDDGVFGCVTKCSKMQISL